MTKTEWKDAFTGYLCRLSNSTFEEAEYEAHHASLTQLDKFGEQVDRWQAPESAAQAVLEEWYPREHMPPLADDDDEAAPVQWRWVDQRGRAMTEWKAGSPPPIREVTDEKGTMTVETRPDPA